MTEVIYGTFSHKFYYHLLPTLQVSLKCNYVNIKELFQHIFNFQHNLKFQIFLHIAYAIIILLENCVKSNFRKVFTVNYNQ